MGGNKISGRANQAAGAVSGDEELKREGEREEYRRKLRGSIDDAVKKAQVALEHLRGKAERR